MQAVREAAIVDVNRPVSVGSAILLGTIGVLSFIIQPGLVQGFVTELKIGEAQAVDLAGIEMLGVGLATVVVAILGNRINWRILTALGLGLGVIGNLASIWTMGGSGFELARFVAGLGEGAIISLSFTFVGLTRHIDRNVALYLVLLLSYGAFGLWFLPTFLRAFGLEGLFAGFAALTAASFLTLPFLPHSSDDRSGASPLARQLGIPMLGIALAAVLAYNMAQGIAWGILFLVGIDAGHAEQSVADALFLSQLLAVAGALSSVFLAEHIGRGQALFVGVFGGAFCIALLLGRPSYATFTVAVCGFNLLWNFVLPFLLGIVGDFDEQGRMISPAIAMQMIGLGAGPIIAGRLIGDGSYRLTELICIACFIASYVLLIFPMAAHRRLLRQSA